MAQSQGVKDFPLSVIGPQCERAIKNGGFIVQKWTCEGCGARVTGQTVNALCVNGHCQHCNHVTDLTKRGCNFMLLQPSRPMTVAEVEQLLGFAAPGLH